MASKKTETAETPETPETETASPPAPARIDPLDLSSAELGSMGRDDIVDLVFQLSDRVRRAEERGTVGTLADATRAITALLDLHRTVGATHSSTVRGRKPEAAPDYLAAARKLGDAVAASILAAE